MAKRGHYGRWSELDLLMAVGTYKNGGAGLNECSRIYNVPKATIKRHADEQNSTMIKIKPRKRAHAKDGLSAIVENIRKKMKTKCCTELALKTPGESIKSFEESSLGITGGEDTTIKHCKESSLDLPNGDLDKTKSCPKSSLKTYSGDVKQKSCKVAALETPGENIKPESCTNSALKKPCRQRNKIKTCKESAVGTPDKDITPKFSTNSALDKPGGQRNKIKACKESAFGSPNEDAKPKSLEEPALKAPSGHLNSSKSNVSKRGQYGRWSENDLLKAVAAYKNGEKGLNECSRVYNVPKATIKRHADGKNAVANKIKSLGRQPTFSPAMEKTLSEHLLNLNESYFELTIKEIRKLVFEIAEKHGLPHSFNKDKKLAGKKWFYSFLRRNPQLSLRKSVSQSPSNRPEILERLKHRDVTKKT